MSATKRKKIITNVVLNNETMSLLNKAVDIGLYDNRSQAMRAAIKLAYGGIE